MVHMVTIPFKSLLQINIPWYIWLSASHGAVDFSLISRAGEVFENTGETIKEEYGFVTVMNVETLIHEILPLD